jgi:hypothetical protein
MLFENDGPRFAAADDCVRHVHIHVLTAPSAAAGAAARLAREEARLASELVEDDPWSAIARVPDSAYAYLEVRRELPFARIGQPPRQWLRRVIASAFGRADWNWRDDPNVRLVEQMVTDLAGVLDSLTDRP